MFEPPGEAHYFFTHIDAGHETKPGTNHRGMERHSKRDRDRAKYGWGAVQGFTAPKAGLTFVQRGEHVGGDFADTAEDSVCKIESWVAHMHPLWVSHIVHLCPVHAEF